MAGRAFMCGVSFVKYAILSPGVDNIIFSTFMTGRGGCDPGRHPRYHQYRRQCWHERSQHPVWIGTSPLNFLSIFCNHNRRADSSMRLIEESQSFMCFESSKDGLRYDDHLSAVWNDRTDNSCKIEIFQRWSRVIISFRLDTLVNDGVGANLMCHSFWEEFGMTG